jgi:acetoacetyl-CoA synthetase
MHPALPEPRIHDFQRWLQHHLGLSFADHEAMWRWSVDDPDAFWGAVWRYFDIASPTAPGVVLARRTMPGAQWFPGTRVNYAAQVLRHADRAHAAGHPAIVWTDEDGLAAGRLQALSWPELRRQVGALAAAWRALGIGPGDRVVAVLPNRPETVVAFLACASLGAVWSLCSPDMGPTAVLDRFRQIEPALLVAGDGYRFGGVAHDRRAVVAELVAGLPTLRHLVSVPLLGPGLDAPPAGVVRHDWSALLAGPAQAEPEWLPFDHPLWVVYSSGTTGLPKPIVHGHGGIVLEALKLGVLHNDLGPSAESGERFHWYSATGWIMWNCQVAGLLGGTTVCLFDGSPAGPAGAPDWTTLWRFAALARCTFFGAGAAFYASCAKAGVRPQAVADLSRLRAVGSTGSPLSEDSYRWIWRELPRPGGRDIWIACISGGTDFAGAFIAGLPTLPMVAGEMQCRCLGARVEAWGEPGPDGRGASLIDEVGELVCTAPMPSMPLYLWGDTDGRRLHESYFDLYPGVWRHGDWLRLVPHPEAGATGAIIYGRSDATINRHGVRMGTAELYRAVESLPEVLDSLVVDLEYLGRESFMPLFVVLREGLVLDEPLRTRLRALIREALSPRHVPSAIEQAPAIPRTLSGKKMELPVKKLLLGADPARVMARDAMANADAVDWFVAYAARRAAGDF